MPEFRPTYPEDGAVTPLIHIQSSQRLNNTPIADDYFLAMCGYIDSANQAEWEALKPILAVLTRSDDLNTVIGHGQLFCEPRESLCGRNRLAKVPWAMWMKFPVSAIRALDAEHTITFYKYDGLLRSLPNPITRLKFAAVERVTADPNVITKFALMSRFAKIHEHPFTLSKADYLDLTLGTKSLSQSYPVQDGSVTGSSFIAAGSFAPNDTGVTKVELRQGGQIIAVVNNPTSLPMGYWAANFANIPAGSGYYIHAYGTANTLITGPFTVT